MGTSVAAFVGLAPGGPINTPMRISNWTQFAKIYGDPTNPDNGPFMEGAYLAHAVYGFFANGGSMCWVVRVGKGDGGSAGPGRAAGRDRRQRRDLPRARQGHRRRGHLGRADRGDGPGGEKAAPTRPTSWSSRPGSEREEYEGLTLKKGRNNLATKVNAASKLIKIEESGESLPEELRVPATGKYALAIPSIPAGELEAGEFEGDVAKREGWAAWPRSTRSRWS